MMFEIVWLTDPPQIHREVLERQLVPFGTRPRIGRATRGLCEREAAAPIKYALADGRLADFFHVVSRVLHTYNPDSAYVALDDWDTDLSCESCGDSCDRDYSSYCDACECRLCDSCQVSCETCEAHFCSSCVSRCRQEGCDACFCHGCRDDVEGYCHNCADEEDGGDEGPLPGSRRWFPP
ncbi:hypothetical protein [Stratiformator vulcanicus]|nr:hypothetical protein [Stratiformator vulcanicus]